MSSFTASRLVFAGEADGVALYRVQGATGDGFDFWIGSPDSGLRLRVPEGFLTDRASLPRWLRRGLKRLGLRRLLRWVEDRLAKGAVVHDRTREDLQFCLVDCDALALVAWCADGLRWSAGGPRWKRLARCVLREAAFLAVRTNRSRASRNSLAAQPA